VRPVAVGVRALDDRRKGCIRLSRPSYEQRPDRRERDSGPRGVLGKELVTAANEAGLERPGLGVESRMQQRRVRLARASADIGTALEQRARQLVTRELSRDRRAEAARGDARR